MKSPTLLLYTTFSFLFFSSALFKTIHRHQNREAYHFSSSVFLPDEQRAADVLHLRQVGLGLGMRGDMEKMKTMGRRFLSEPGSSPPHCISKCGSCTPCKPVRVAVPPGTPVTEEYYPEAWRCKCGNRLYMP